MLIRIYSVIIIFYLPFITSASFAADDQIKREEDKSKLFQSKDIFDLEFASDPRISPDGQQIVYVRKTMDIMKDSTRSNFWTIEIDGSEHRPLLSDRQSYGSPRWSPDGDRIAYITGAEGSPQLYVRWMDTGQTALLTNLTEAPGDISWSPDGKWLAFTMQIPSKQEPLAKPPAKPEGAEWAPPVNVIDRLIYRADGQGFLKTAYTHIFIVSAEGGTPRQLTSGDYHHNGPLSWTADSGGIIFSANRYEDWEYDPVESEIFMVTLDGGELTQLTNREGADGAPVVSPNGKLIAYTGYDDRQMSYQPNKLYLMNIDGSNSQQLLKNFDYSIISPRWGGNNRIYFLYDDKGIRKLAVTNLAGKVTTVAEGVGGTTLGRPYTSGHYSVAKNGNYVFTINSPSYPADISSGTGRRKPQQLTHLNEDVLGHKQLGQVKSITWKSSHDEREIQGWLVTPPNFDSAKKYPFILEIHGGPFAAYGPNFSAEVQRYAAEGYVVLYANPRGSTSYGEEFANQIHDDYPGNDFDDLMSGVDAVLQMGFVDEENLFVTGGSGGGVLTAWIVGKTDRFRAAVVAKPVINWTSFTLTADFVSYFYKYWFAAFPWERQNEYWRRSPLSLAGNVTTPTMLLTGEADYRTPIAESEQFYIALKLRKVDTALVRVPGAPHGIALRPSNLIAKADNIIAWFDKYRTDKDDNKAERKTP